MDTPDYPGVGALSLKFYPRGKFRVNVFGPKQYLPAIEECLKWGVCDAWAKVDKEAFAKRMNEKNIPEQIAREFLENISISDDIWAESAY